jgi:hypothetical protein
MIEPELSLEALQAISTAIGEIMEDCVDRAISMAPTVHSYSNTADLLHQAGQDIASLAAAMEVLVRRSGDLKHL